MSLVSAWEAILHTFLFAFTEPTGHVFSRMATGWVLTTGRRTVCGIIPFADPKRERAHDCYHRFFSDAAWSLTSLWWECTVMLVERFVPEGVITLFLDDTVFHRRGPKVDGAGIWRDAVTSIQGHAQYAFGLNMVVLSMRVTAPWGSELALPVNMRLRRKGDDQLSLPELAQEMVRETSSFLPERDLLLVCDGFYASLAGKELPRTTVISRLRTNAALFETPGKRAKDQRGRPRTKGKRLPSPKELAKRAKNWKKPRKGEAEGEGLFARRLIHARQVLWYGVCKSEPILLIIARNPTDGSDMFLFCTDPKANPREVVKAYAARWAIEVSFRDAKQDLGAQQPQVWKADAPEHAVGFALFLYTIIWSWYLTHGHRKTALPKLPWYPAKERPSFKDALAALRRVLWRQRIFGNSGRDPASRKNITLAIEALGTAA